MIGKKIFTNTILILFIVYYSSITLFHHAHIIDGVTLVHSHLYDISSRKSNHQEQNHKHEEGELIVIQLLSQLTALLLIILCCKNIFRQFEKELRAISQDIIFHKFKLLYFSLRAPPIHFFH